MLYIPNEYLSFIESIPKDMRDGQFIDEKGSPLTSNRSINLEVQKKIKKIICFIELNIDKFQQSEIEDIFFDRFSHLHSEQFPRNSIPEKTLERLRAIIRKDRETQQTFGVKQIEKSIPPSKEYEEALFEVKLALKLEPMKRPIIPKGGTSQIGILTDIHGKHRLVIKPSGRGSSSGWSTLSRIKKSFKNLIGAEGQEHILVANSEMQSEAISTQFAKRANFKNISETHVVHLSKELTKKFFNIESKTDIEASAQLFASAQEGENYVAASLRFNNFKYRFRLALHRVIDFLVKQPFIANIIKKSVDDNFSIFYGELNPEVEVELQKFWIFDFLIGNLDRHEENWLLKFSEKTGEISGIMGIDQGAAFYKSHPENYFQKRNQYKWAELKEAKHFFVNEAKKFAQTIIENKDFLKDTINLYMTQASIDDRNEVIKRMEERVDVLRLVVEGNVLTPFHLGQIKSSSDFQKN